MTKLRQNTYKICDLCNEPRYHHIEVPTDMLAVLRGELDEYEIHLTYHGCRQSYIDYRSRTRDEQEA